MELWTSAIVTVPLLSQSPGLEKAAVTLFAVSMVTVQVPVPLHAPVHPAKELPMFGVAERVMEVPVVIEAEQVEPQLMTPVEEVTVPVPVPDLVTESVGEPDSTDCPPRTGQTDLLKLL